VISNEILLGIIVTLYLYLLKRIFKLNDEIKVLVADQKVMNERINAIARKILREC